MGVEMLSILLMVISSVSVKFEDCVVKMAMERLHKQHVVSGSLTIANRFPCIDFDSISQRQSEDSSVIIFYKGSQDLFKETNVCRKASSVSYACERKMESRVNATPGFNIDSLTRIIRKYEKGRIRYLRGKTNVMHKLKMQKNTSFILGLFDTDKDVPRFTMSCSQNYTTKIKPW